MIRPDCPPGRITVGRHAMASARALASWSLVIDDGSVDPDVLRLGDELVLGARRRQSIGRDRHAELQALLHEGSGDLVEDLGARLPQLREDGPLFVRDMVLDAGSGGRERGAEARLVGRHGDHVAHGPTGQLVLGLCLVHLLVPGHAGHGRIEDRLLEGHVRPERGIELIDQRLPIGTLGLLDLGEELLGLFVIGFQHARHVHLRYLRRRVTGVSRPGRTISAQRADPVKPGRRALAVTAAGDQCEPGHGLVHHEGAA